MLLNMCPEVNIKIVTFVSKLRLTNYQTDYSPGIFVCHQSAELWPGDFDGNRTGYEEEKRPEQTLPVERFHQRERGDLDAVLEKSMQRRRFHATNINNVCKRLTFQESHK